MNGTNEATRRSVQLAVMSSPSASVVEAVAEARRRNARTDALVDPRLDGRRRRLAALAA